MGNPIGQNIRMDISPETDEKLMNKYIVSHERNAKPPPNTTSYPPGRL